MKASVTPSMIDTSNKGESFYESICGYIYFAYENYFGIHRNDISFNDVALTLTIIEAFVLITLIILLKWLLNRRSRRNETLEEREIRLRNTKINSHRLRMAISASFALYYAFFL